MAKLKDWHIAKGNHYHLMGFVNGHHRMPDDTYVTTSAIQDICVEGECLFVKTKSGTLYEMELVEIREDKFALDSTIAALKEFEISNAVVELIQKEAKKKEEEKMQSADQVLENQELLLVMFGGTVTDAYFKSDYRVEKCGVDLHVGMFQDSILITLPGKVDFRYFPNLWSCRVYSWSDGLKQVKIKNDGSEDVVFSNDDCEQRVKPGEIKVLDREFSKY